jgi:hypothetical protein
LWDRTPSESIWTIGEDCERLDTIARMFCNNETAPRLTNKNAAVHIFLVFPQGQAVNFARLFSPLVLLLFVALFASGWSLGGL